MVIIIIVIIVVSCDLLAECTGCQLYAVHLLSLHAVSSTNLRAEKKLRLFYQKNRFSGFFYRFLLTNAGHKITTHS